MAPVGSAWYSIDKNTEVNDLTRTPGTISHSHIKRSALGTFPLHETHTSSHKQNALSKTPRNCPHLTTLLKGTSSTSLGYDLKKQIYKSYD